MDINTLLKALDNEENAKFINVNTQKINDMKKQVMEELELPVKQTKEILAKLKYYMYIDEMNDLRCGAFLRWIPITDPENIYLMPGGILCDIQITQEGIVLICKNFAHKHYQFKMDECLIFQKLTNQEQVLLSALDYLEK